LAEKDKLKIVDSEKIFKDKWIWFKM
jgi:hypothetical protein